MYDRKVYDCKLYPRQNLSRRSRNRNVGKYSIANAAADVQYSQIQFTADDAALKARQITRFLAILFA